MFGDICMGFFLIVIGLLCLAYLVLGCLHFLDLLGFIDLHAIRESNRFNRDLKKL